MSGTHTTRVNARYIAARLDGLQAAGFDLSFASGWILYPRCSRCTATVTDSFARHESGCPNDTLATADAEQVAQC